MARSRNAQRKASTTAAEFIVLGVRSEDGTQQDATLISLWRNFHTHFVTLAGDKMFRRDLGYIMKLLQLKNTTTFNRNGWEELTLIGRFRPLEIKKPLSS